MFTRNLQRVYRFVMAISFGWGLFVYAAATNETYRKLSLQECIRDRPGT